LTELAQASVQLGSVTVASGRDITVASGGDIVIQDGGDIHLNAGGDIYMTPSDTDPSEIRFGSSALIMARSSNAGVYVESQTDQSNYLMLGRDTSHRWRTISGNSYNGVTFRVNRGTPYGLFDLDYKTTPSRIEFILDASYAAGSSAFVQGSSSSTAAELFLGTDGITRLEIEDAQVKLWVDLDMQGNFIEFEEMSAPSAPGSNAGRLYCVDVGGKTALYAVFPTGVAQQIAIEP
jgi:hypothetical protein